MEQKYEENTVTWTGCCAVCYIQPTITEGLLLASVQ